jgi:hypothetical protein
VDLLALDLQVRSTDRGKQASLAVSLPNLTEGSVASLELYSVRARADVEP